jgi:hypothetical protein
MPVCAEEAGEEDEEDYTDTEDDEEIILFEKRATMYFVSPVNNTAQVGAG